MRFKDKKINNIPELVRYLKKDIQSYMGPIWFRGQSNKNWQLLSSFERLSNAHSEQNLIKIFKQNATLLLDVRQKTNFDWLFIMQHHGMPTRLLDWTESPLFALYFAICDDIDVDGALYALIPVELNKESNIKMTHDYEIPSFEDKLLSTYDPDSLKSEVTSSLYPIASIATRNNSRMQAQLSVFTIAHREPLPIETIGKKKHIWRYVIPKERKTEIAKELKLLAISKFQLFPELQNISENIMKLEPDVVGD